MIGPFTRRNFLLGLRNTGILALMPPALTAFELEEKKAQLLVGAQGPELFPGLIKGIADGPITRSCVPKPHSLSTKRFTLIGWTETMDLRPIGGIPQKISFPTEWSMEAWVRAEADLYSYLGEPVHISAKAGEDSFYNGSFLITEVSHEYDALA